MAATNTTISPVLAPMTKLYWTFAVPPGGLPPNLTAYSVISAFSALALWLSIELLVQLYFTFKRCKGLYYWSCLLTTCGIILQVIGFSMLQMFAPNCPRVLYTLIGTVGWNINDCGFSVVLYSRLHLTGCGPRLLRRLLILIVLTAIVFHTPITVCAFGLATSSWKQWVKPRQAAERIQQIVFSLQETALSSIYIWNTARFLGDGNEMRTRHTIALLVITQLFVIGCDAALATMNFVDLYTLRCMTHPFVYALKLKIEFIVLNQLRGLVKHGLYDAPRLSVTNTTQTESRTPKSTTSTTTDCPERARVGSDITLCAQDIGGDKLFTGQSIDDIEKQYLGRFGYENFVL